MASTCVPPQAPPGICFASSSDNHKPPTRVLHALLSLFYSVPFAVGPDVRVGCRHTAKRAPKNSMRPGETRGQGWRHVSRANTAAAASRKSRRPSFMRIANAQTACRPSARTAPLPSTRDGARSGDAVRSSQNVMASICGYLRIVITCADFYNATKCLLLYAPAIAL